MRIIASVRAPVLLFVLLASITACTPKITRADLVGTYRFSPDDGLPNPAYPEILRINKDGSYRFADVANAKQRRIGTWKFMAADIMYGNDFVFLKPANLSFEVEKNPLGNRITFEISEDQGLEYDKVRP